jgi:hypothetical protein
MRCVRPGQIYNARTFLRVLKNLNSYVAPLLGITSRCSSETRLWNLKHPILIAVAYLIWRSLRISLLRFTFLRHVYTDDWNSSEVPFGSSRKNQHIGWFTSPRHIYMVRDPSRMQSLHLNKPLTLFPQCSLPRRSRAFVLHSNTASVIVRHAHTLTLLLPWLHHDGSAPDRVGHRHRWPCR